MKWPLRSGFVAGACATTAQAFLRRLLLTGPKKKNTPGICYRIHNVLLLPPILCQLNPVDILKLDFLEPSVIIPSTHIQLTCSKTNISHLVYQYHMSCPSPVFISLNLMKKLFQSSSNSVQHLVTCSKQLKKIR